MMGLSFIFGNSTNKDPKKSKKRPKEIRTYMYQHLDTKERDILVSSFVGSYRTQRSITITTTQQGIAQRVDNDKYRVIKEGFRTWPEELVNTPETERVAMSNDDGSQLFTFDEAVHELRKIEEEIAQQEGYVILATQPHRKKHFERFAVEDIAPRTTSITKGPNGPYKRNP